MKKTFLIFSLLFLFSFSSFAARNTSTIVCINSSQLIKTGDAKIYAINFVASANGGNFAVLDAITDTLSTHPETLDDIKAEGSEATAANGKPYDFRAKPLEMDTGIYVVITDGYMILEYE